MIDPLVSLSFSLYSKKGAYALLLGSGVSRASGIKTGWEIILDLICKIAHIYGESCDADPVAWYSERFKEEPDYGKLICMVAKSSTERNQLLKGYFEPTEAEKDEGLKLPSQAHKSIANLVSKGYIRVIITTNFDRLTEKALEANGVAPIVISTVDAIEGALPLSHIDCLVLKVNGDYLDIRIKNTDEELKNYDEQLCSLLDRIFDEYGLIVCGWSADWDIALRGSLERCRNHRFTTYWASLKEIEDSAKKVATLRRAEVIRINNADDFFQQIEDKVLALEEYKSYHPLTVESAVTTLKRYLSEDRYIIRLQNLVVQETEKTFSHLNSEENFPLYTSDEAFPERLKRYESLMGILIKLMMNGCYWGKENTIMHWQKSLERIADFPESAGGAQIWLDLRFYPALLLIYGGGIASVLNDNYKYLKMLLYDAKLSSIYDEKEVIRKVNINDIFHSIGNQMPGMENQITPINDYIYSFFKNQFKELEPSDIKFQRVFDRFEYLLALVLSDINLKIKGRAWMGSGAFLWREAEDRYSVTIEVMTEFQRLKEEWLPLKAGLFEGSIDRANYVIKEYNIILKENRKNLF
jgi:hypothetical protein